MDKFTLELYIITLSAILGYFIGKLYDSVIKAVNPDPDPIISIILFLLGIIIILICLLFILSYN